MIQVRITVAYAASEGQVIETFEMPAGCRIRDLLALAAVRARFPSLITGSPSVGIFGRVAEADTLHAAFVVDAESFHGRRQGLTTEDTEGTERGVFIFEGESSFRDRRDPGPGGFACCESNRRWKGKGFPHPRLLFVARSVVLRHKSLSKL